MNSTSEIVASCLAALRSGGMRGLGALAGRTEALMASPGAGAEVAGLVGEEEGAEMLLEVALDAARMAREDRQTWGDGFVESVEAWIAERDAAGDLPAAARIGLGRAFTRAGLAAPPGIALKLGDGGLIEGSEDVAGDPRASLLDSLKDLRRDVGDDPPSLYQAMRELLALVPPEVRGSFVGRIAGAGDPALFAAASYWLLDPDAGLRRAAAEAFERLAEEEPLPSTARLALMRPWLPAGAARDALDRAIRAAMRHGGAAPAPPAWQVSEAWATLPDGRGASSIAVAARQGRRRVVAMVLLKLGHGVKDAYLVPCRNARDQAQVVELMSAEVEVLEVPPAYVAEALAEALGEGVAAGALPASGLVDVAEVLGLAALAPQVRSVAEIVAAIDPSMSVRRLSAREVARVVAASQEFEPGDSWIEASEALDAVIDSAGSDEEVLEAIHASIEARRDWWARLLARAATVMAAVDDPDWISAAVTAELLADGGDPRDLPIMAEIAELSLFGDDDLDAVLDALPREPPEPEREGELAGFLADRELTPDWVDGFLMAAAVAPDPVSPGDWLGCLFEAMGMVERDDQLDRLIAIVMARYNAVAAPQGQTALAAAFAGRPGAVAQAWLAGFADFVASFRDAWRPGIVPKADRSVLRQIQDAGAGRADDLAKLEAALPRWLAGRYAGRR